jgi:hypothetical protein
MLDRCALGRLEHSKMPDRFNDGGAHRLGASVPSIRAPAIVRDSLVSP